MAEQEACTELVEKASQEQSSGALEGESQLLPLLQGLLEAPENEQFADSGIESGEDQRSGLIAEVQIALEKLSASLRSDSTGITTDRRSSLLQLVTKLQNGLATTPPKLERRLSSGPSRFNKKRDRQNRHTVGVSSEELADARRLMEEISLHELTPSQSKKKLDLQKQLSESSVNSSSSSFNKFSKATVKNATAKPFSSSSNSLSNASSSVQTPTDPSEHLELLFGDEPTYHEAVPTRIVDKKSECAVINSPIKTTETNPLDLSISDLNNIKCVRQAAVKAARKKVNSECIESETEDDASTVKEQPDNIIEKTPSPLQENPIYTKPQETNGSSSNLSYEEKVNRFNTQSKKLKMKRANTIDIPKPLQFYEDENDSESETEDEAQKRKNAYLALRGPIRVGNSVQKNSMPVFEPKTKSDKKFLDFINKNSPDVDTKPSAWSYKTQKTPVWGNKFSNMKNNFEKPSTEPQNNSARNFWKTQDDAATVSGFSQQGPKISKRSARSLQQMFEEKQRESVEKTPPRQTNIVTGSLTVKTEPERNYKLIPQPLPVNKFSHAPQSAFKPIPKKSPPRIEEVSNEPKTEIIKTELNERATDAPLFLYSPKPMFNNSQNNSAATSPITSKPWIANAIDHGGRVVNLAAKKFEVPQQADNHFIKPRKLNKDVTKIFTPQQTPPEKHAAPYLNKSVEQKSSTVRKLSAEYDSLGGQIPEFSSHTSVKYQPAQSKKPHYVPSFKLPQNMPQNFTSHQSEYVPHNTSKEMKNLQYSNSQKNKQTYPSYVDSQKSYPQYQNPPQPRYQQTVNTPQNQGYKANYSITYQTEPTYPPQNYSTRYDSQSGSQNYGSNQHQQTPNYNTQYGRQTSIPKSVPSTPHTPEFQPVNYSIRYDQPGMIQQNLTPDSISSSVPSPQQFYQNVSGKSSGTETPEQEYISTVQFSIKPKSSVSVKITEPISQPPKLETQLSTESLHEYTAINSKVMTGPVSQQAVTVHQKSPKNRNEHDMEAAFNLKSSLQQLGKKDVNITSNSPTNSDSFKFKSPSRSPNNSFKYKSVEQPKDNFTSTTGVQNKVQHNSKGQYGLNENCITGINNKIPYGSKDSGNISTQNKVHFNSNNNATQNKVQYTTNKFTVDIPTKPSNDYKISRDSFKSKSVSPQIENKTYGVVKPMQQKPPNTIYNNVSGVRQMRQESLETNEKGQNVVHSKFHIPVINVAPSSPGVVPPNHAQVLSKSDSWHQICMANQSSNKPSPRGSPMGRPVLKSKSSHSLAVPQKQFEAGMSKEELVQKKKSIEAYFSTGKSPQPLEAGKTDAKVVKRSINRIKTSEKVSTSYQPVGLARSRTLPDIVCPDLLDESNVDKAFDDLFKSNTST